MNGFVNWLLRYWTMLSTFQMPLVYRNELYNGINSKSYCIYVYIFG